MAKKVANKEKAEKVKVVKVEATRNFSFMGKDFAKGNVYEVEESYLKELKKAHPDLAKELKAKKAKK